MALRDEVLADTPSIYLELNENGGLVSPDSSGNGLDGERFNGGPHLLKPPFCLGAGGALGRGTYTTYAIQIPEWRWSQHLDNWTFMLLVAPPNENITIKAQGTSGVTGTNGDQRYVASNPAGIGASSACLSVGRNAIQVFEHGDGHLPCLLSYAPATPFEFMRFMVVHVVCVNKQIKLYIDGVLVKTGLASARAWIHPPRQIHSDPWSPGFRGGFDEAAWWPFVLSDARIAAQSAAVPTPRPKAQLEANNIYQELVESEKAPSQFTGLLDDAMRIARYSDFGPYPQSLMTPEPPPPDPPPTWWPIAPAETRVPVAP